MITTLAAPIGAATPEAALALYDLARTSGAASAYEAAAHALARALQRQIVVGATLRRPAPLSAPLGAPSEPIAKPPTKARASRLKQVEDDLAAIFARPSRANAATGSFWAVWADGSATRVCGVIYHAAKPKTRWSAALRAADTLRRLRARHAYARDLAAMAGCEVRALQIRTSCGVMVDSPDWQRLAAIRPLPALAAIYDETSGETFTPPPGMAYGAGDAAEAAQLESRMVPPRLFWRRTEIAAQGFRIEQRGPASPGIAYWTADDQPPRVADGACDFLAVRRADALAAFALPVVEKPCETARPGDLAGHNLRALDGRAVVIDLQGVTAALEEARDDYRIAHAEGSARRAEAALSEAKSLLQLVGGFAATPGGDLIRYTLQRLAGAKAFRLHASNGASVMFDAPRVRALRLAA